MPDTSPDSTDEAPIQTTSTFNIQNLVTPGSSLRDIPVDISRMLYMLYQDVEQQINRADFKAQITLSTSTILAALAVNLGLGFKELGLSSLAGLEWLALAFYALCALFLCAAIGFALAATYPRSVGKGKKQPTALNLYFSADIIQLQPDDFLERFLSQSNEKLKESVIKQIQIKARVLEAKLSFIRHGLRALVTAVASWGMAHAVLLLAYRDLM
jgi:hypothetical protein